ncbi:MAG: TIR domain-containing protein [Acidobacteria bacterium]|nr:TIR domain-containing protein [Acidobacteriota bacterium]
MKRTRCRDQKTQIFISYGREDARKFAKRLAKDIRHSGYRVFLDLESISKGGLWEVTIERGIKESSVVLAVLSRHALLEKSICRDEVVYALYEGKPVLPIRQDPDPQIRPPLLLVRRNWIDFAASYQKGFSALLRFLEKDDSLLRLPALPTIAGVEPLDFSVEIARFTYGFTGRKWLCEEISQWLQKDNRRAMVIVAEPGVGKSSIAAWLSQSRSDVLGIHFCTHQNSRTLDPNEFVACLVSHLHARLPGFAQAVEAKYPEARRPDAKTAFRELIIEPARSLPDPKRFYLVVIDSLDEAISQPGETIVDVLASQVRDLPPWLRVITTTRPEQPILQQIKNLNIFEFLAERTENIGDLDDYITSRLKTDELKTRVVEKADEVKRLLSSLSDGNFLYARLALEALRDGSLGVSDLSVLSPGLSDFYGRAFVRSFPDLNNYVQEIVPLLAALSVASGPLPFDILCRVAGKDRNITNISLNRLRSWLKPQLQDGNISYSLFHKSLQDWLCNRIEAGNYWCDPASGHASLTDACWAEYRHSFHQCSDYTLRYLNDHLCRAQRWNDVDNLLQDASFGRARRKLGLTHELISDLAEVSRRKGLTRSIGEALVEAYSDMLDNDRQHLRASLHKFFGSYAEWPSQLRNALEASKRLHVQFFLGDTHAMENRLNDALHVFTIMKRRTARRGDEAFCASRIRLAYSLDQKGLPRQALRQLLELELDRPDARKLYGIYYWWASYILGVVYLRLGMFAQSSRILTEVYKSRGGPGLPASALHHLGVIDLSLGNLEKAKSKFSECLRMRDDSPYNHRRAYDFRRLGQLYAMKGCRDQALKSFDEALKISKYCADNRYVDLILHDKKSFLSVPDQIFNERPDQIRLNALAVQFKTGKIQHTAGVKDVFRALSGRELGYLNIFDSHTRRSTRNVARWDVTHNKGFWHAAVMVLLVDQRGRIALQRRGEQDSKGRWDVSVSGHLEVAEEDQIAAVRETYEEVGLALMPERLQRLGRPFQFRKVGEPGIKKDHHKTPFSFVYRTDKHNRELLSLFIIRLNKDEASKVAACESAEVLAVKWQHLRKAAARVKQHSSEFASSIKHLLHPLIMEKIQEIISSEDVKT